MGQYPDRAGTTFETKTLIVINCVLYETFDRLRLSSYM